MPRRAVEVSETLRAKLKNFRGTETELKQLLYNERYFNQRIGRKTRNMQIDMSAYFQDVIPARYIHEDFDMKNQRILGESNLELSRISEKWK